MNHTYKDISKEVSNSVKADRYLSKKAILSRMIDELPTKPWANIEILDWLPEDNNLLIEYSFADTPFGEVLVANTSKGVCYLGVITKGRAKVLEDFRKRFKHTTQTENKTFLQKQVLEFLSDKKDEHIIFHLKGTAYQTEIWRKLTRIPYGKVVSYATLGGNNHSARAAGTANGKNPIFWIIPCQRAVKTTGEFDRYFWGEDVKKYLLAWEFVNSLAVK